VSETWSTKYLIHLKFHSNWTTHINTWLKGYLCVNIPFLLCEYSLMSLIKGMHIRITEAALWPCTFTHLDHGSSLKQGKIQVAREYPTFEPPIHTPLYKIQTLSHTWHSLTTKLSWPVNNTVIIWPKNTNAHHFFISTKAVDDFWRICPIH